MLATSSSNFRHLPKEDMQVLIATAMAFDSDDKEQFLTSPEREAKSVLFQQVQASAPDLPVHSFTFSSNDFILAEQAFITGMFG